MARGFISSKGDYRNLIVFKKAECIYDLTFHFTKKYLSKGDRTVDRWSRLPDPANRI